jgi:hypothetical protein
VAKFLVKIVRLALVSPNDVNLDMFLTCSRMRLV